MHIRCKILVCILSVLCVPMARATIMLEQDIAALTQSSTHILKAKVISSKARLSKDRMRIMTDTKLHVLEVWKGHVKGPITAMQPGGITGEIAQKVHGAARFDLNEEVVVFLEARGNRFTVTGMAQGAFHLRFSQKHKKTYALQRFDDGTQLVDPIAHKPITSQSVTLTFEQLKLQVLKALDVPVSPAVPSPPTKPEATSP